MSNESLKWSVAGKCVRGFTHIKQDKPCQDAIYTEQLENGALIVVADGHGSERCTYSEDGSRIAVGITANILKELYNSQGRQDIIAHDDDVNELLKSIEKCWKKDVENYHNENGRERLDQEKLYIKYGTTLLGVLVTPEFIFCLQLGDGDIIVVTKDKQVKFAIKKDNNLLGNETTSLCSYNSWKEIKTKVKYIKDEEPPVLILVSTDGYYNSFISVEEFKKVGLDYLHLIRNYGLDEVKKYIGAWLEDSSREGSGDDITLGLICSNQIDKVVDEISPCDNDREETTVKQEDNENISEKEEAIISPLKEVTTIIEIEEKKDEADTCLSKELMEKECIDEITKKQSLFK
ncbi:MAG: protein phosphatase 2C domain-containing protein [Clostridium sp.]|uniref:PP2C family serine/threonine-protein phosphatase n=1 Tax=Clostridium sp. TaxID=1506 RepID=UPI0025BFAFCD|nr:PP2C family serine/threonine-protein phosphatase [Clostridium sp.]MCE5220324.1 protein phosphatase 2C domain-containing protein [Clostridium sp.]